MVEEKLEVVAASVGIAALGVVKVAHESSSGGRNDDNPEYTDRWMKSATDNELDTEREKVRFAYCSSGDNFDAACRLQNLLRRFDTEMSDRAWGDEEPHAPSYHREHGYYLPNDD